MSYTIQYQWRAFRMDLSASDKGALTRYAVAIEEGPNNLYETRHGVERRARDWGIAMLGTRRQVLRQAVRMASWCELGELRQRGRPISPECFIGKVKRHLADAVDANSGLGHLVFRARVKVSHPLASVDLPFGFARDADRWYGEDTVLVSPPGMPEWLQFFRLIDPYIEDGSLSPLSCGAVYGLPSS